MSIRHCRKCAATFPIDSDDREFYQKVQFKFGDRSFPAPEPTHCPNCRLQRRLAFRNQNRVARIKSSSTGELLFSQFLTQPPFPVISNKEWWDGANWSAESYGRNFDFSRTFFDQLRELSNVVPRPTVNKVQSENSDYCNNAGELKNCYLVFDAGGMEDCFYCDSATNCKDCIDCSALNGCELCYDCTSCGRCYDLQSSEDCTDCSESLFLRGCRSSKHCFGSVNLRHREYCIFNKQVSKDEYDTFIRSLRLDSFRERTRIAKKVLVFWNSQPRPHIAGYRIERCTGNHIHSSKEVRDSFFVRGGDTLRYCMMVGDNVKNCYDYYSWGENVELLHECCVVGANSFHCAYCENCWNGASELLYSIGCIGATHSFGCVSMQKVSHCILNKRYSAEAYNEIIPKIIQHMKETGEWGEFMPMALSPHPYNITLANRYFPLDEPNVRALNLKWYTESEKEFAGAISSSELPDSLPPSDVGFNVKSSYSGKPFKITIPEVKKFRKFNAPLPRTTYSERMDDRAILLGPIKLVVRPCEKTGIVLNTAYSDRQERVMEKEAFEAEFV